MSDEEPDISTPEDDAITDERWRSVDRQWMHFSSLMPDATDDTVRWARTAVDHFVAFLLPYGDVVVDRARFERLRHVVSLANAWADASLLPPETERERAIALSWALDALEPGDLDPLP